MPREQRSDSLDQLGFLDRELRLGLFLQIVVAAFFQLRQLGADDQVLDGDFALRLLVAALDDGARAVGNQEAKIGTGGGVLGFGDNAAESRPNCNELLDE